eukprot:2544326-Rhodomonas_salina.2
MSNIAQAVRLPAQRRTVCFLRQLPPATALCVLRVWLVPADGAKANAGVWGWGWEKRELEVSRQRLGERDGAARRKMGVRRLLT